MLQEENIACKEKNGKRDNSGSGALLCIVGIGPGDEKYFTLRAVEVLENAEIIVCYKNYLKYVEKFSKGKELYVSGMKQEIERAEKAIDFALQGKRTVVVSTGDAGIYGMSGLVLELLERKALFDTINIEVVPGVSAFNAAASILGAPIMHDFAVISLSDLLTDWKLIEKRIENAAEADFVICIYNPKSRKRTFQIEKAREIMLKHKDKNTPVAIVKNALRENEAFTLTTLERFLNNEIDMLSVVIVGNSQSRVAGERFFLTPRGYHKKMI
jgi:precorrin-3B C17-methyltransferase